MTIEHLNETKKRYFVAQVDDIEAGRMTYT
jgi:hypothetical protein